MVFSIKRSAAALAIVLLAPSLWAAGSVQGIGGFEGTGGLPSGFHDSPGEAVIHSDAWDITPDGSIVVGSSLMATSDGNDVYGRSRAFTWTPGGDLIALVPPGGTTQYRSNDTLDYVARAVSADGHTVVGNALLVGLDRPFVWRYSTGMMFLLPETESAIAHAVSANGSIVVGGGTHFSDQAFMWTEAQGITYLETLSGYSGSSAYDISADGSVIVGSVRNYNPSYTSMAFRWTEAVGMVALGDLGGGYSDAYAVSADGSVIVGSAGNAASHDEAFRWTQLNGMMGLGTLGGLNSSSLNVSANGLVVVGHAQNGAGDYEAFRWSESTGMQSVRQWLEDAGVDTTGFTFTRATAANADGSVLIGWSTELWQDPFQFGESWIARVSPFGSGIMNPQSFNDSLTGAQDLPRASEYLLNLPMNGAHHRPLMAYDFGTDACGWVTADHAKYTRETDAEANTAEFGSCIDYLDDRLRIGIAAGKANLDQDLALGGSNDLDGYYVMIEADYRFAEQLIGSLLVMQGEWDVDADRAYLNGASVDVSSGNTDITELAVRARLDWMNAFALGAVQFSPRVAYTWTDTKVDDYAETGGGFPVYFGRQSHNTDELRAGLDADWAISKALTLRGMLEGIYRFDDEGDDLQGQVIGLYSVTRPYEDTNESWVRAGAELEYRLGEYSLISVSLNGASRGEDPDVSGAISFRMAF